MSFLRDPSAQPAIREAMAKVTQREEAGLPVIDFSSGNAGKIIIKERLFTKFQIEINESLEKPLKMIGEALKKGLLRAFYREH